MNKLLHAAAAALLTTFTATAALAASDDGITVDKAAYANRQIKSDFTAAACPDRCATRNLTSEKIYGAPPRYLTTWSTSSSMSFVDSWPPHLAASRLYSSCPIPRR
jgi:hypothetical protein